MLLWELCESITQKIARTVRFVKCRIYAKYLRLEVFLLNCNSYKIFKKDYSIFTLKNAVYHFFGNFKKGRRTVLWTCSRNAISWRNMRFVNGKCDCIVYRWDPQNRHLKNFIKFRALSVSINRIYTILF